MAAQKRLMRVRRKRGWRGGGLSLALSRSLPLSLDLSLIVGSYCLSRCGACAGAAGDHPGGPTGGDRCEDTGRRAYTRVGFGNPRLPCDRVGGDNPGQGASFAALAPVPGALPIVFHELDCH